MTPDELARLKALHTGQSVPAHWFTMCKGCNCAVAWPCLPRKLIEEIEAVEAENERLRSQLAKHHEGSGLPAHRCVTCVVEYTP